MTRVSCAVIHILLAGNEVPQWNWAVLCSAHRGSCSGEQPYLPLCPLVERDRLQIPLSRYFLVKVLKIVNRRKNPRFKTLARHQIPRKKREWGGVLAVTQTPRCCPGGTSAMTEAVKWFIL